MQCLSQENKSNAGAAQHAQGPKVLLTLILSQVPAFGSVLLTNPFFLSLSLWSLCPYSLLGASQIHENSADSQEVRFWRLCGVLGTRISFLCQQDAPPPPPHTHTHTHSSAAKQSKMQNVLLYFRRFLFASYHKFQR